MLDRCQIMTLAAEPGELVRRPTAMTRRLPAPKLEFTLALPDANAVEGAPGLAGYGHREPGRAAQVDPAVRFYDAGFGFGEAGETMDKALDRDARL